MCLYPRLITNRKYTITKKNKGIIPPITDQRVSKVAIGCGKCLECSKQKRREWTPRLSEDIKHYKNAQFITLTFSDESYHKLRAEILKEKLIPDEYTIDNQIATLATRRFLERWRKKNSKSVRHWLVTELGQTNTERIHLHGIIYTDQIDEINNIWGYGHTHTGTYVNENTIKYITKYISKMDFLHKEYKPIILCSPGIGKTYIHSHNANLNRFKDTDTKETYSYKDGTITSLPKYYRNNLYTEEQREKLWLNLLDKQIRYVLGIEIKIDNAQGIENYYNCLNIAQAKNTRLGYGNNEINWERKKYENERRKLIRKKKRP